MFNTASHQESLDTDACEAPCVFFAVSRFSSGLGAHHSEVLLSSLSGLTSDFQQTLVDKETAWREMGTALGSLHELVLLIMCRVLKYQLTASHVLVLFAGDVGFAMQMVCFRHIGRI